MNYIPSHDEAFGLFKVPSQCKAKQNECDSPQFLRKFRILVVKPKFNVLLYLVKSKILGTIF